MRGLPAIIHPPATMYVLCLSGGPLAVGPNLDVLKKRGEAYEARYRPDAVKFKWELEQSTDEDDELRFYYFSKYTGRWHNCDLAINEVPLLEGE